MKQNIIVGLVMLAIIVGGTVYSRNLDNKRNSNVLGAVSTFSDLSPNQFDQALNSGKYTLIDVRTVDEYSAGHLKNAKQSDFYQTQAFSNYLDSLNKNANYLIYCRTGHRSASAMQIMQQKGFPNVYDLTGGYNAWITAGLPIAK